MILTVICDYFYKCRPNKYTTLAQIKKVLSSSYQTDGVVETRHMNAACKSASEREIYSIVHIQVRSHRNIFHLQILSHAYRLDG